MHVEAFSCSVCSKGLKAGGHVEEEGSSSMHVEGSVCSKGLKAGGHVHKVIKLC